MTNNNPDDRKYTKEHEWVKIDGDIATVGITHHAQELLTDVVFVELPELGKQVQHMKQFAVIESVKSVSDVFSPVTGEVTESNKLLEDSPQKVNEDAFGEGWIAKIKFSNHDEINNLMSSEEYNKFCEEEQQH
jgi:glycine cleavage system H protein